MISTGPPKSATRRRDTRRDPKDPYPPTITTRTGSGAVLYAAGVVDGVEEGRGGDGREGIHDDEQRNMGVAKRTNTQ